MKITEAQVWKVADAVMEELGLRLDGGAPSNVRAVEKAHEKLTQPRRTCSGCFEIHYGSKAKHDKRCTDPLGSKIYD